jgi:hypothetical protein
VIGHWWSVFLLLLGRFEIYSLIILLRASRTGDLPYLGVQFQTRSVLPCQMGRGQPSKLQAWHGLIASNPNSIRTMPDYLTPDSMLWTEYRGHVDNLDHDPAIVAHGDHEGETKMDDHVDHTKPLFLINQGSYFQKIRMQVVQAAEKSIPIESPNIYFPIS